MQRHFNLVTFTEGQVGRFSMIFMVFSTKGQYPKRSLDLPVSSSSSSPSFSSPECHLLELQFYITCFNNTFLQLSFFWLLPGSEPFWFAHGPTGFQIEFRDDLVPATPRNLEDLLHFCHVACKGAKHGFELRQGNKFTRQAHFRICHRLCLGVHVYLSEFAIAVCKLQDAMRFCQHTQERHWRGAIGHSSKSIQIQ